MFCKCHVSTVSENHFLKWSINSEQHLDPLLTQSIICGPPNCFFFLNSCNWEETQMLFWTTLWLTFHFHCYACKVIWSIHIWSKAWTMLYFTKYGVKLKRNLMQRMRRRQSRGILPQCILSSCYHTFPYVIVTVSVFKKLSDPAFISDAAICP